MCIDVELSFFKQVKTSKNNMNWTSVKTTLPPEGTIVETKIEDSAGERNIQKLIRKGNLYWFTDDSMYVYYTPTHWRFI
jgi:hypothetical protein